MEALAVPAGVAMVADKQKVGFLPGVDLTLAAGGVVVALAFCSLEVAGGVDRQPVVAATETGGSGTVVPWDSGVG